MRSQWERLLKSQGYLQASKNSRMIWWISSHAIMSRKTAINPVSERHLQCTSHSNSPSKPLNWHSLLDGIPCRKNSFRSLLHLITWHQLGSGLQLRTWLTNKDVSFASNWPNGMVRRRALNPSAFTARHVQQRQLQNKKQKKAPIYREIKNSHRDAQYCKTKFYLCTFLQISKVNLQLFL